MEINISAIVPVYGVEKYLPRCLRSLEEQTIFERVEVILIDDGSPDRCGAICDEFAARHPRNVRVIHKENGGVSSARNAGLDAATGAFIGFVDSDDFVEPECFARAYGAAVRTGADVVCFGFASVWGDEAVMKLWSVALSESDRRPSGVYVEFDGPEGDFSYIINGKDMSYFSAALSPEKNPAWEE